MALNIRQNFQAGFLPALAGSYFNLVELLSRHAASENDELKALVQSEIPKLSETGRGTVESINTVRELAGLAGTEKLAPPRFPKDYYPWFDTIHREFLAKLDLHTPEEVAYRVGHHAGHILCSINVATMTIHLLSAAPDDDELRCELRQMLVGIREALDDLRISARNPSASASLWDLALSLTDAVDFVNIARRVFFASEDFPEKELVPMGKLLQQKMADVHRSVLEAIAGL